MYYSTFDVLLLLSKAICSYTCFHAVKKHVFFSVEIRKEDYIVTEIHCFISNKKKRGSEGVDGQVC